MPVIVEIQLSSSSSSSSRCDVASLDLASEAPYISEIKHNNLQWRHSTEICLQGRLAFHSVNQWWKRRTGSCVAYRPLLYLIPLEGLSLLVIQTTDCRRASCVSIFAHTRRYSFYQLFCNSPPTDKKLSHPNILIIMSRCWALALRFGKFVVQQFVELLWACPLVVLYNMSVAGVRVVEFVS